LFVLYLPLSPAHAQIAIGISVEVGCTVAPGFEFASFELAPPGWELR
jgi:uncharacterized protein